MDVGFFSYSILGILKNLTIPVCISYHYCSTWWLRKLNQLNEEKNACNEKTIAYSEILCKKTSSLADLLITVSPDMIDYLEGIGLKQVKLWPPVVDSHQFTPDKFCATMRKRLSLEHPNDTVLLYVGRLSKEKNIQFLRNFVHATPHLHLAIVGDGSQRDFLESYFKGTSTVFLGRFLGKELCQAYASADIFVFASECESLGFSVLEAMASGCPVLCARSHGVQNSVTHKKNGLLYTPNDSKQALEFLKILTNNPQYRKKLGHNGRRSVGEYTWLNATLELRSYYKKILKH